MEVTKEFLQGVVASMLPDEAVEHLITRFLDTSLERVSVRRLIQRALSSVASTEVEWLIAVCGCPALIAAMPLWFTTRERIASGAILLSYIWGSYYRAFGLRNEPNEMKLMFHKIALLLDVAKRYADPVAGLILWESQNLPPK